MESDLRFLQDLFKRFVPAKISMKHNKHSKRPIFEGWLNITAEQSKELAGHAKYQEGPFIFITGESTRLMTVDVDRRNSMIKDHEGKIDGVEYWDEHYPDPAHMNTLIIKTPSGGFHLVYKYEEGINSGQLEKDVLIDILSNGKGMCFGPGYEILTRTEPLSPPRKLVQQIVNVNYGNQTINKSTHTDLSTDINNIAGCNLVWDVIPSPDNKVYTLIPHTNLCTVEDCHVHSESKHSRFVVTKRHVVAKCFSHSTDREVDGVVSKRLREFLFPESSDAFEDFMQDLFKLCVDGYMGRMNGHVCKVRKEQPWIYDRVESYEDFINTNFSGSSIFVKNPRRFSDVLKYMETIDNPRFPFLKKEADYIGFDNCVLNIVTFDVSTEWKLSTVPRHSMHQRFSWDNLETPLFDGLLQYQLGNGDVYRYFLGLLGRLLFATKRFDNYNIVPIIKGDTGTGKSTILEIVQKMYAPGAVGIINTNNETTFGLQNKYDKELLIAHEIGDRFTERLSSDLFKQMVCGEDVSVPRKNKAAIDVKWQVPMLICSNVHVPYTDNQGSISRRLAIFKFDKYVSNKDATLETRIIGSEMPAIIGNCLLAYNALLQTIGSNSFWTACPDYFHENTRDMSEQTDYLYMFLTLPPGDNIYGNKDVYFMKKPGTFMLLQDFKHKFINYMRFRHPGVKYKWTSDYNAFKRLGYDIEHINICKACGATAKAGCCTHYNIANRCKRYIVKDLACIDSFE